MPDHRSERNRHLSNAAGMMILAGILLAAFAALYVGLPTDQPRADNTRTTVGSSAPATPLPPPTAPAPGSPSTIE